MWKYSFVLLILMQIYSAKIIKLCSLSGSECPQYSACVPYSTSSSSLPQREAVVNNDILSNNNTYNDNFENSTLKCLCIENFRLNPLWQPDTSSNDVEYCLPKIENSTKLMTNEYEIQQHPQQRQQQQQFLYFPIPTSTEDLIFSVLLIILAAIMILMILFGLKALQPLKRAQAAYRNLQHKQQNIVTLQEFDDFNTQRYRDLEEQANRV